MSRRAFLARAAGVGALAVGAVACGRNDAGVFAQGGSASTAAAPSSTATTDRPATSASTVSPSSAPATSSSTTSTAPAGSAVRGELVTRFTYAAASGRGRINNPYVAVWVEDAAGELVDTIALWYLQGQKGSRWLPELTQWYEASAATRADTVSSATRAPGAYTVSWDGTDTDGEAVAAGSYHLCIEAAREHGPHSLIRQAIDLGAEPFSVDLPANAELRDASATFTPR